MHVFLDMVLGLQGWWRSCKIPFVKKSGISKMDLGGWCGLSIKLLNNSDYKIWRLCLKSFLVGKDLWEVVGGNNRVTPAATKEMQRP